MRGFTTWTKALASAAALTLASAAQAAPGNGLRLGGSDARLHPFLDLETRYDSNVSYTANDQAISDLILHIRPGVELKAPGELAAMEFTGALDWAQYLGIDQSDTTSLSKLYANAALAVAFNRSGTVSPRIDNTFARQVSTTSLAAVSSAVVSNQNTLTLAVPWKPGGGALVLAANAQWLTESYEKYKDLPAFRLSDLGYNQYRFGGELQWRFLPRTSGLLQAGYFTRVPNLSGAAGDASGFDVLAGVTGLMTPRIAATAKAGFGNTTSNAKAVGFTAKNASSFLADVAAEWLPADTISVKLGYTRSLGVDPTVSAYTADGVSGGIRVKLAERFALRAGARYDHMVFESIDGASTDFLRIDPGVDGTFGRWLSVGLGYVYSMRAASWPVGAPPDYAKHEAFLKVGLTY